MGLCVLLPCFLHLRARANPPSVFRIFFSVFNIYLAVFSYLAEFVLLLRSSFIPSQNRTLLTLNLFLHRAAAIPSCASPLRLLSPVATRLTPFRPLVRIERHLRHVLHPQRLRRHLPSLHILHVRRTGIPGASLFLCSGRDGGGVADLSFLLLASCGSGRPSLPVASLSYLQRHRSSSSGTVRRFERR
jgi:hypothetical protein